MIELFLLKNHILNNKTISFGYMFGSYANDTYTNDSDIDIALYLSDRSLDNKLQLNYELSKLLKKDVDLVVLNEIKNIYLLDNIIQKSILIKDSDKRIDFELTKQHDIIDYKEFKRMIDAA